MVIQKGIVHDTAEYNGLWTEYSWGNTGILFGYHGVEPFLYGYGLYWFVMFGLLSGFSFEKAVFVERNELWCATSQESWLHVLPETTTFRHD